MSLFYEAVGALIANGGEVVGQSAETAADERARRDLRQVALLCRRIGAIWPELFASLQREIEVLDATAAEVETSLREHGAAWSAAHARDPDPLRVYRSLLAYLEQMMSLLHRREEPWAVDALRIARRGLARAAEIQGELVDQALDLDRAT